MDMADINTNDTNSTKYITKFLCGNKQLVIKKFLKSRNVPDISSIPIYSQDYINESTNITQEKLVTS